MEKWNMHAANKADTKGDIEEELNRLEISQLSGQMGFWQKYWAPAVWNGWTRIGKTTEKEQQMQKIKSTADILREGWHTQTQEQTLSERVGGKTLK